MKAFPNSIKRAGADIAVDHAQGRQDHPRRKRGLQCLRIIFHWLHDSRSIIFAHFWRGTKGLDVPFEGGNSRSHHNHDKNGKEQEIAADCRKPNILEKDALQRMDRIGFGIDPGEHLEPFGKAGDRIDGAARKKQDNIKEATQNAHDPGMIESPQNKKHQAQQPQGCEDDDDNDQKELAPKMIEGDTGEQDADRKDKQSDAGGNEQAAPYQPADDVRLGERRQHVAFIHSQESVHDQIKGTGGQAAEEDSHNHHPRHQ